MTVVLEICLAAALAGSSALQLDVARDGDALNVKFELLEELPSAVSDALPSGAPVAIEYLFRVRAPRRLWWDRKVVRGAVISSATFDPVTGRYICELVLDGVIVASEEVETDGAARQWLRSPPAVRLGLPPGRRSNALRVRIRGVFASSTTWLIFPSVDGTDWVEIEVPGEPEDGPAIEEDGPLEDDG